MKGESLTMKTAFIFAGQGAQTVGMGKSLYDNSAAAKQIFDEADSVLGWSVSDICFNGPAKKLTESAYCQPAIYTVSMACHAAFMERFGDKVQPCAAAGLSLGEYAAFACAGFFTFADGLRLVAKRGALMDQCCRAAEGGMASVLGMAPEVIAEVCAECGIDVANYNCPGQIVISGPKALVADAAAKLKEKGARRVIPLNVAGAFHSRMMKEAGDALAPVLDATPVNALKIPVAQNFTGKLESDVAAIKSNLQSQVAGSVRWDACVNTLTAECGIEAFVEMGPGMVLSGLVRKIDSSKAVCNVGSFEDLEQYICQ